MAKKTLDILVGADPELFVKLNGEWASAHGLVKGDKKNPHVVECGAVQVDGMALEFNIDPAKNKAEFIHNLNTVMATLAAMTPEYEIVAAPVAHFGKELIDAQPFEARELGCEPDFSAWNDGQANPRPNVDAPFRTGAGHIHIGWTEDQDINDPEHLEACIMVAKQLDFYLAIPSLLFDKGQERRKLYGDAGAFRPKSYGVEYRTLSNAWLESTELMAWVYEVTQLAINDLMNGKKAYLNTHGNTEYYLGMLKKGTFHKHNVSYFMHENDIPCPPGFEIKVDQWGDAIGFKAVPIEKHDAHDEVIEVAPRQVVNVVAWDEAVAYKEAEAIALGEIKIVGAGFAANNYRDHLANVGVKIDNPIVKGR